MGKNRFVSKLMSNLGAKTIVGNYSFIFCIKAVVENFGFFFFFY